MFNRSFLCRILIFPCPCSTKRKLLLTDSLRLGTRSSMAQRSASSYFFDLGSFYSVGFGSVCASFGLGPVRLSKSVQDVGMLAVGGD